MSMNFSVVAGDSLTLEVAVVDEAGAVSNITSTIITWTAAASPFGAAVITKSGTIINGVTGRFDVLLLPADTAALNGNYYHQALIVAGDGSQTTIFLGLLTISPLSALTSVELFKVRYPEFASVSSALISLVLEEASDAVGDTWLERDRNQARMLLAAHKLAVEGEPARSAGGQGLASVGQVKRRKVGDVETEFAGFANSGNSSLLGQYGTTAYGQAYMLLMRKNFPAIEAV